MKKIPTGFCKKYDRASRNPYKIRVLPLVKKIPTGFCKKYVRASRNPYKIRLKLKNHGAYGGIFRSQPQLCNKSGRVSFDDPLTSPACGARVWSTPPEKPE